MLISKRILFFLLLSAQLLITFNDLLHDAATLSLMVRSAWVLQPYCMKQNGNFLWAFYSKLFTFFLGFLIKFSPIHQSWPLLPNVFFTFFSYFKLIARPSFKLFAHFSFLKTKFLVVWDISLYITLSVEAETTGTSSRRKD